MKNFMYTKVYSLQVDKEEIFSFGSLEQSINNTSLISIKIWDPDGGDMASYPIKVFFNFSEIGSSLL